MSTTVDVTSRPIPEVTDQDRHLFNEGRHHQLYRKLGCHLGVREGIAGAVFRVWAPDAREVSVVGDWNGWQEGEHPLRPIGETGIWERFVEEASPGQRYKYLIESRHGGYRVEKADPFAFYTEAPPRTASVIWDLDYAWDDRRWMAERSARSRLDAPMSIYEVHLGSWRRGGEADPPTYRRLAEELPGYVRDLGFTHVELLPVMEHPFYGSWGYQTTGYFAPTSRYGTPQDFMHLVDRCHQEGIGVILDWVPSHFPSDQHGLGYFDGTHLYEHADARLGYHPDWHSLIFNYGRNEVRAFLISSARFWLDHYHVDGLRVDAVASMLYLDYSRKEGEWIPNEHGGRENLPAIQLLRELNERIYADFPGAQTIAEESTAWPMVSKPTYVGGLGFGYKWDMGWMHDTLEYLRQDPVHRRFHHNQLTFRGVYAFHENFVLSLSHDEVVHGKGSLPDKMPGDQWQKLANLRLLLAYQIASPGKKLLFMGCEIAQWREWSHERSLDWDLLEQPPHRGVQSLTRDLNAAYAQNPALHELDCDPAGFEWLVANDGENSVLGFLRKARSEAPPVAAIFNFTPVAREAYRLGVPHVGWWHEILNSDAESYGGSGVGNLGGVEADPPRSGLGPSLRLRLPPLGALFLRWQPPEAASTEPGGETEEGDGDAGAPA
ncbi:MAG TPA: 1,4-alpha-glucan branching protein GlgB [Thermoanaerobaculia bacterium]|nr:1,4-alpha-glucan branching protein GlgB [Thermoanaerobaculia bacterium]